MNRSSIDKIKRMCVKKYLVSFSNEKGYGFAVIIANNITLEDLSKFIEKTHNLKNVVINNIVKYLGIK